MKMDEISGGMLGPPCPQPIDLCPYLEGMVRDELAALAKFRAQTSKPTKDLLDFFGQLTDGTLEGDDGVPSSVRVGAGFAIGTIHAIAHLVGTGGEELVALVLSRPDEAE